MAKKYFVLLDFINGKPSARFESVNAGQRAPKNTSAEKTIIVHTGDNERYARMLTEEYNNDFKELEEWKHGKF